MQSETKKNIVRRTIWDVPVIYFTYGYITAELSKDCTK